MKAQFYPSRVLEQSCYALDLRKSGALLLVLLLFLTSCTPPNDPISIAREYVSESYYHINKHKDLFKMSNFEKLNGEKGKGRDGINRYKIHYKVTFVNTKKALIEIDNYNGELNVERLNSLYESNKEFDLVYNPNDIILNENLDSGEFVVGKHKNSSQISVYKWIESGVEFHHEGSVLLKETDNGWQVN